jgi:hypothetical protein
MLNPPAAHFYPLIGFVTSKCSFIFPTLKISYPHGEGPFQGGKKKMPTLQNPIFLNSIGK